MSDDSAYKLGQFPPNPVNLTIPPLDPHGLLTEEDKKKILAWFQEKFSTQIRGFPKCEMCGTNQWNLEMHTVTPMIFGKQLQLGGVAYPQVMLSCAHCGNIKFFSAIRMGVTKQEVK